MLYPTQSFLLKNGKEAVFRSPRKEDAAMMVEMLHRLTEETEFLLRSPEETMTVEQEEAFLQSVSQSENNYMIICEVDGQYVGNCNLQLYTNRVKTRHRGTVAIGLAKAFWGMGIGTIMFEEMIRLAREAGAAQLELGVFAGNERGLALYRKMGFRVYGELPNAFRMKDGSFQSEMLMVREL